MIEWRSLRARLTFLFVAIFGLTLVGFSAVVYRSFLANLRSEFDQALYNHAVDVAESVDIGFFGDLRIQSGVLRDGEKLFPFSPGKALLQILTPEGAVVIRSKQLGSRRLPFEAEERDRLARGLPYLRSLEFGGPKGEGGGHRMITTRINRMGVPPLILQIAMPTTVVDQQRARLIRFFASSIPLVLLLASLGGLYLSARALEPVKAMIEKARSIGADRLSERLPVPAVADEVQALARTINGLLERLEGAFRSQESFIADASHQLKTPLAVLRGELDLVLQPGRTPEEIGEFLRSASQEIDFLSRMVEDLLVLARVDAGAASRAFSPLRMDELLLEVISRLASYARSAGVELRLNLDSAAGQEGSFEIPGDAELLQCLFRNLIENAVKFAPRATAVSIRLAEAEGSLAVSVRDQGPGIPADDIPKLFERFFRSGAQKGRTPGFGLGLPIAQKIARFHGGSIEVSSVPGQGAEFLFRMKKV